MTSEEEEALMKERGKSDRGRKAVMKGRGKGSNEEGEAVMKVRVNRGLGRK